MYFLKSSLLVSMTQHTVDLDFTNLQGKRKLVQKIGEFEKSGVKCQGKRLLVRVIGRLGSKNWGFEKSGFHCNTDHQKTLYKVLIQRACDFLYTYNFCLPEDPDLLLKTPLKTTRSIVWRSFDRWKWTARFSEHCIMGYTNLVPRVSAFKSKMAARVRS